MQLNLYSNGFFYSSFTDLEKLNGLARKLRPTICDHKMLRIGKLSDGGYLIPDDLSGIAACFSPGVEDNSSFESDLISQTGIPSHLADYSVSAAPSNFKPKSFLKKFVGPINDDIYITLEDWIKSQDEHLHTNDLLLQMDIEGDEYISILSTSDEILKRFRIIILEIHNVECWANPIYFKLVENFFQKILNHFYIVHNHPNNHGKILNLNGFIVPQFMEMTFLRKDRTSISGYRTDFPHALDRPCFSGNPELILPPNWCG